MIDIIERMESKELSDEYNIDSTAKTLYANHLKKTIV